MLIKNSVKLLALALSLITVQVAAQNITIIPVQSQPKPDSIVLAIFKGTISGNSGFRERIVLKKKSVIGEFTHNFPKNQPIIPFTMWIYYGNKFKKTQVYYTEPSDQVRIRITETSSNTAKLDFSGRGADKFKLRDIIDEIITEQSKMASLNYGVKFGTNSTNGTDSLNTTGKIESGHYYKTVEFRHYLDSLYLDVKAVNKKIQDTLLKYESHIGRHMREFYSYELNYYYPFVLFTRLLSERATVKAAKDFIAEYYLSIIDSITPRPKDELFIYGLSYRNRMSDFVRYNTYYKNNSEKYPFHVQYGAIKKEIKNLRLREILITKFLAEGNYEYINDSESKDSCLNDAINLIHTPELSAVLNHQLLFRKGTKMYDFSFVDTLGNKLSLTDMKNKVFIIDFYFNGCASCALFSKRFAVEVYPEFANNPNFEVLSVNIDVQRESWIKAIKSGLYTVHNSINLSTGMAFKHPIFSKYNIHALPWVLLIGKDGRVIDFHLYQKESSEIQLQIEKELLQDDI